jgi:hypothetical protein
MPEVYEPIVRAATRVASAADEAIARDFPPFGAHLW